MGNSKSTLDCCNFLIALEGVYRSFLQGSCMVNDKDTHARGKYRIETVQDSEDTMHLDLISSTDLISEHIVNWSA